MAGYYNDLVTQKSWQTLQNLRGKLDFVLIGGWAVYLYTKSLKSKDIDLIINYDQLDVLKKDFEIIKNDRLKKYEARREEVQIDIYLPFYSDFGIPAEEVIRHVSQRETFKLPTAEMLLILKQLVFAQRGLSTKGQKDRVDILSLLNFAEINFGGYKKLLKQYDLENLGGDLERLIKETIKIPEISVNEHQWSRKKNQLTTSFRTCVRKFLELYNNGIAI